MAKPHRGFVYLDLETAGLDSGIHPLIAAAHQEMDANGPEVAEPTLLTSWGLKGEKALLRALVDLGLFVYQGPRSHDLIPVGSSLDFTLAFTAGRLRITQAVPWDGTETANFLASKPRIDIKGALALMNRGAFEGADVRLFTRRKVGTGADVVRMYADKDFEGIERYIRAEAAAFFDVFPAISKDLHLLGDQLRSSGRPAARR